MKDFAIQLTDRPGELARVATALSRYGVNVKAVTGTSVSWGATSTDPTTVTVELAPFRWAVLLTVAAPEGVQVSSTLTLRTSSVAMSSPLPGMLGAL